MGNLSAEIGTLPSRLDVGEWPRFANDPLLKASWEQLVKGRPMPVVPEMRALWDVMRPGHAARRQRIGESRRGRTRDAGGAVAEDRGDEDVNRRAAIALFLGAVGPGHGLIVVWPFIYNLWLSTTNLGLYTIKHGPTSSA